MIRINLLPVRAAQKKEKLRGQLAILILCLILTVAACGGAYSMLSMKVTAVKKDISRTQNEINRLKKTLGEVSQFKKRQADLRGKLEVLEKIKAERSGPVRLLDELSRAIPKEVWIDSFKERGGNISISGQGLNEASVASFMRSLETSPYYQGVELSVIEQVSAGGRKLQKFSLTCRTESPAEATR